MLNKLDGALNFQETALRLRSQRQELLAANIANADTPGYKARDINFTQAFQQALQSQASGSQTATTHPGHIPTSSSANQLSGVLYRSIIQGSVDGNTVDMDTEQAQFTDNALRYEAGVTMISGQIKKLLSVIQGQ